MNSAWYFTGRWASRGWRGKASCWNNRLPHSVSFITTSRSTAITRDARVRWPQFDWGLNRSLSATGGMVRLPVAGTEQRYFNLGLRAFWQSSIISSDLVRSQNGGSLTEMAWRTRVGGASLDVSRAILHDFISDLFLPSGDPVRTRDKIRIDGTIPLKFLPRLPLTLEAKRDHLQSGADNIELAGRISTYQSGISMSNALRWRSLGGAKVADGTFQASRRMAGIGWSGDINYTLKPETDLTAIALSADKSLAAGYLLNLGVVRSFSNAETLYTAGLNKSLGSYGLDVSASYSSRGAVAVGARLFMGLGREPRQSVWLPDAQPIASAGAASIRVFEDKNLTACWMPARSRSEALPLPSTAAPIRHVRMKRELPICAACRSSRMWILQSILRPWKTHSGRHQKRSSRGSPSRKGG